jgi:hypothetical protein
MLDADALVTIAPLEATPSSAVVVLAGGLLAAGIIETDPFGGGVLEAGQPRIRVLGDGLFTAGVLEADALEVEALEAAALDVNLFKDSTDGVAAADTVVASLAAVRPCLRRS